MFFFYKEVFEKDVYIIKEGELSACMYFIREGEMTLNIMAIKYVLCIKEIILVRKASF